MSLKLATWEEEVVLSRTKVQAVILPFDSAPSLDRFVRVGNTSQIPAIMDVFHEWPASADMHFGVNREALFQRNQVDVSAISRTARGS